MTMDDVADFCGDLARRAQACDRLAAGTRDEAARRRCEGKAQAYRHAADMLRLAARRATEAS